MGLRERAARPDDDFGLPGRHERSKFEKKNVSGYFGPKSGPPVLGVPLDAPARSPGSAVVPGVS